MIRELVQRNRSFRRFYEEVRIGLETLRELVDLARLSASGGNRQPLKYFLSVESNTNEKIFRTLTWAVYLKNWRGPAEGERPAAYIIVLGDTRIAASVGCDHGIAWQSILLGAVERGLGGCIVGSIKRDELRGALNIPEHLEILLAIALGKPKDMWSWNHSDRRVISGTGGTKMRSTTSRRDRLMISSSAPARGRRVATGTDH